MKRRISKILNSNIEIPARPDPPGQSGGLNKSQTLNSKTFTMVCILGFGICLELRNSCFGFSPGNGIKKGWHQSPLQALPWQEDTR